MQNPNVPSLQKHKWCFLMGQCQACFKVIWSRVALRPCEGTRFGEAIIWFMKGSSVVAPSGREVLTVVGGPPPSHGPGRCKWLSSLQWLRYGQGNLAEASDCTCGLCSGSRCQSRCQRLAIGQGHEDKPAVLVETNYGFANKSRTCRTCL